MSSTRGVKAKDKTFFLHLPKTAGTSLWASFREIAGPENVLQVFGERPRQEFLAMPPEKRASYVFIGGHFPLELYSSRLDLSQYYCTTVFRDPTQRILSDYRYKVRYAAHPEHRRVARMSLREYVPAEDVANLITKSICGRPDAQAAFAILTDVFDDWVFIDEVDQLVARLFERAGLPVRGAEQVNVAPLSDRGQEVDQEVLAQIQEHHAADLELYAMLSRERAAQATLQADAPVNERTLLVAAVPRSETPVFDVVTPSLNSAQHIDETIESVVSQKGDFSIRYHIQDGGSLDGTMEIVRGWQDRIQRGELAIGSRSVRLTADSERDSGMYDAIASGFRHLSPASSDLMTWINADDKLAPGAMATIGSAFEDLPDVELVGGRVSTMDADGKPWGASVLIVYPRRLVAAGLCDERHVPFIMQEGTFWRFRLWERARGIDPKFRLAGDWDLWRRFAAETEYVTLDVVTAYHRRHVGQLSEDKDGYYREIDDHLADRKEETESVFREYLHCWTRDMPTSAQLFPSSFARLSHKGRWSLLPGLPPRPQGRKLLPLDGDWTEVSGFDHMEGPYPDMGIEAAFHWTSTEPATLDFYSAHSGRRKVSLALRSLVRRQKVDIRIDGGAAFRRVLEGRFPANHPIEQVSLEHNFEVGIHCVEIQAARSVESADGRKLGVMFSDIRFESGHSRRKSRLSRWWPAFGSLASGS